MLKECTSCKVAKELAAFSKKATGRQGLRPWCKACIALKYQENRQKILAAKSKHYRSNRSKKLEYQAQYNLRNKAKISQRKSAYRQANKAKMAQKDSEKYRKNRATIVKRQSAYDRRRCATDPYYRFVRRIRCRMALALTGKIKSAPSEKLLGCSFEEVWRYLESKFQAGMTRENYGQWHIDHIRPLSSFDLSDPEQQRLAFHYTNLQPLWAKDNLRKGAKLSWRM